MKYWLSLSVSKRPRYNKSYDTLVTHHKYPLVVARLHFFRYIASILKALLVRFQTDRPMVPFLSEELDSIIRRLLSLFIKKKVLTEAGTPHALMKIDIQKKENRLLLDHLGLGSATKSELAKTNVSEDVKSKFKNGCTVMLVKPVKLIEKIIERSPLKYSIVRYAECFNASEMVNCADSCILKSSNLIQGLYELKILSEKEADNAKQEYQEFISSLCIEKKDDFLSFNMDSGRLDVFFGGYLHHNDKFSNMWKVCKVILTLSHGQADVERGFSINKEMLVDNMRQTSLINQRLIFDHLSVENTELADFTISKDLLNSCKCASGKYKRSLEENKKEKVQSEGASKRKLI